MERSVMEWKRARALPRSMRRADGHDGGSETQGTELKPMGVELRLQEVSSGD